MKNSYLKYFTALLLFGSNGIVASLIELSSHEIVFLRTMIGSILLIALFFITGGKLTFHKKGTQFLYLAISGVAMGASWMFLYEAYQQIGVSISSLLYYCGPVIVMILSPFIFKEKLTAPKIIGFIIVLMGLVLINGNVADGSRNTWGIACGVMSAFMYFFMVTLNKQSRNITGMENAGIQLVVSFLTVAVFVGLKQGFVIEVPSEAWIWILILGVVNTGIGCYLYFSPLAELPVQTVAVCGYLEPLSAVVFAAVLLNENMTAVQIIGAICIIGGAMVGELVKNR